MMDEKRIRKIAKKLRSVDNNIVDNDNLLRYLYELSNASIELVLQYELHTLVKPFRMVEGEVGNVSQTLLRSWKKANKEKIASEKAQLTAADNSTAPIDSDKRSNKRKRTVCDDDTHGEMTVSCEPQDGRIPSLVTLGNGILNKTSRVHFSNFTVTKKQKVIASEGSHQEYTGTGGVEKFKSALGIRDPQTGVMKIVPFEYHNELPPTSVPQPTTTGPSSHAVRTPRKETVKTATSKKANVVEKGRERSKPIQEDNSIDSVKEKSKTMMEIVSRNKINQIEDTPVQTVSENKLKAESFPVEKEVDRDTLSDEEDDPEAGKDSVYDELLPPMNPEAKTREDIYPMDSLIPSSDWEKLRQPAKALYELVKGEDASWKEHFSYNVRSGLENEKLSEDDVIPLLYLHYMFQLSVLKANVLRVATKPTKNPLETGKPWDAPLPVARSLIDFFSDEDKTRKRIRTKKMKDKLMCFMFALALHTGNYSITNVDRLRIDTDTPKNRVSPLARLMRLRYSVKNETIILKLPLPKKHYPPKSFKS